ncbi:MAG: type I glyceraldehyde-3-phosphate dehydrogenase [Planctomycetota bacterium]
MSIRVAINGFGRIGRLVFRVMTARPKFEVVAINDLSDAPTLAHLLKYDTVHGRFQGSIAVKGNALLVNGREIPILAEKEPAALPWKAMNVDVVVESTGVFTTREKIAKHLEAGAKKVLLTVPAKDKIDATIVLGVNEEMLKSEDRIVSNASCTTNCLAPLVKALHDAFGVQRGLMTTIHAYTNDQRIADLVHKDLRRARAAALNIIPTTTGAARAIGEVIPALKGKLDGMAMRVPVADGSMVDLVVNVSRDVTKEEVNAALKKAADGPMKGILACTEEPIVSSDVIGTTWSSLVDLECTSVIDKRLVKVVSWYDNEYAYSCRVADLIEKIAAL